jgi:hypothetical protein
VAINLTLVSDTDNTDALGTAAISWSDLFLGSGSVITWSTAPSTADITLTHSANALAFAGGTVSFDVAPTVGAAAILYSGGALGTPSGGTMTNVTGIPVGALANGTDGQLITWGADGVATTVATGDSGQVLTSNGAGAAPTFQAGGSGSSTIVQTLIDPQVNISSVGDTYTDTVGNTYAETTNQTRLTMSNTRVQDLVMYGSGHVSAGTGTFEIYNFTDSASLGTKTTTATSEATFAMTRSLLTTNNNDAITIRVKNSGAGGTITIDSGGLISADRVLTQSAGPGADQIACWGGYMTAFKMAFAKAKSTTTCTGQLAYMTGAGSSVAATTTVRYDSIGAAWDESVDGTVFARTLTRKLTSNTQAVSAVWSAIGDNLFYGVSEEITADDL